MWNDEITLIGFKITGKDKLKQDLTEKVKTTIFCKKNLSHDPNFTKPTRLAFVQI